MSIEELMNLGLAQLAKHAQEGWDLANARTAALTAANLQNDELLLENNAMMTTLEKIAAQFNVGAHGTDLAMIAHRTVNTIKRERDTKKPIHDSRETFGYEALNKVTTSPVLCGVGRGESGPCPNPIPCHTHGMFI